jgi:hypothetical protein
MASILVKLRNRWQRLKNSLAAISLKHNAEQRLEKDWKEKKQGELKPSHPIPGQLIVNLTSFPARFDQLHLTLKSLLLQQTQPDKFVLWIYEKDLPNLPNSVLNLKKYGLVIESCSEDTRSYKKLIPALQKWPNAFHVTADDDIYYRENWLTELTDGYHGNNREVLCLRAHLISRHQDGSAKPYKEWLKKTFETESNSNLFPTTGAGTLFPPNVMHQDVLNQALFLSLAPYADDIWFYWMTIANNNKIRRVGSNQKIITWPSSKKSSLWSVNKTEEGGNDAQFEAVFRWLVQIEKVVR